VIERALTNLQIFELKSPPAVIEAVKSGEVDIILKYVKLDVDTIRKAFYEGYLDQSSDPNKNGVKDFWRTMRASEFVSSEIDISPFISTTPYKSALDSLAEENPNDQFWTDLHKVYSERNL